MNNTETIVKSLMLPGLSEDTVTGVVTKYADSLAIGFAEWLIKGYMKSETNKTMYLKRQSFESKYYTIQELLTLYKSETTK